MARKSDFLKNLLLMDLPQGWRKALSDQIALPYFNQLSQSIEAEYRDHPVYPAQENLFRALHALDLKNVKVVILGQDPYHGEGQAVGLSFAVPNELLPKPPSLTNIFKELTSNLATEVSKQKSDLSGWVKQGVLLLNSVLTVRASEPFSHRDLGWEIFTDEIISCLNLRKDPVVFIFWGAAAQKKKRLITGTQHFFLESVHPSPLSASRGFFGSKPFSKANGILKEIGKTPVDWAQTTV